jgi:hypothetical protein
LIALVISQGTRLHANPEVANFSFSTNTRMGAQAGYFRHFVPSEGWGARMNWTGSVAGCNPGTLAPAYYDDTLRRVNYYRRQAGLPADIINNATKSAKCEWATLIFSSQDNISHTPAIDFPSNACVVSDKSAHGGNGWGHEAASQGNLSLGSTGPDSISSLMVDSGSSNGVAGHRRWFLYPLQQEMGFGGVPLASSPNASACVWVIGGFKAASSSTVRVVPWPNAGFIPWDQIPNATNSAPFGGQIRWSCGYTNGNFASATVSMARTSGAGAPATVAVTKEAYAVGYGDNTIGWLINSASSLVQPTAGQDISYNVTIAGITLTTGVAL